MNFRFFFFLSVLFIASCIGDDYIDDFVEPVIQVNNAVDTLQVGTTYQLEYTFRNDVGQEENIDATWTSSDESIITVDQQGLVTGVSKGSAAVTILATFKGIDVSESIDIVVDENTVIGETNTRTGMLKTTSSYLLEGDFELNKLDNDELILNFSENYKADTGLPGLYVYLSNNPNSIADALEIAAVEIFEGTHSYNLGVEIDINDYSHVLFYCKPFNVKVGDGVFDN